MVDSPVGSASGWLDNFEKFKTMSCDPYYGIGNEYKTNNGKPSLLESQRYAGECQFNQKISHPEL